MKYFTQETKHNPPESYGDCVRTCLACLLNREPLTVPNFFDPTNTPENFDPWLALEDWLADAGYCVVKIHVGGSAAEFFTYMDKLNPGVLYMLCGSGHAIICSGATVVHDPSWLKTGVEQPELLVFILPASMLWNGELPPEQPIDQTPRDIVTDDGNPMNRICPDCNGCGWSNPAQAIDKCERCNGSGVVE